MSLRDQNQQFLFLLTPALSALEESFADMPETVARPLPREAEKVLAEAAHRLRDNYPYFHPLYVGQMLRPPHPIARAAYALAMSLNPNNHALDGGRASSAMEMEAVAQLAAIFGWEQQHLGHLSSGGTFANLEALWVAGQLRPGQTILASEQAHYTHNRISHVLQLPFEAVASDAAGRMDLNALEDRLKRGGVGTVVATLGTTGLAAVDPLDGIVALRQRYGFRLHVDAAYGGYFRLIADELDPAARQAYLTIHEADSIVVDPHKHGLQPYGCGSVLFRDPSVGQLYKHDSPYTYFSSKALHLGEISLECSRAGATAVALWATQRLLPLVAGGEFAQGLSACRRAALSFHAQLASSDRFLTPIRPELDIVIAALRAGTAEESSRLAQQTFDRAAAQGLHLALLELPRTCFAPDAFPEEQSAGTVLCLRSVMMKPEHEAWVPEITRRLLAVL